MSAAVHKQQLSILYKCKTNSYMSQSKILHAITKIYVQSRLIPGKSINESVNMYKYKIMCYLLFTRLLLVSHYCNKYKVTCYLLFTRLLFVSHYCNKYKVTCYLLFTRLLFVSHYSTADAWLKKKFQVAGRTTFSHLFL